MPESSFDVGQLLANTFVRHVELHDELGSTNDRAVDLASQLPGDELPALVVARRQTAGRGRGRNAWWSADGALTFSLLMDQDSTGIRPSNWPQLSLATAVAVCDVLAGEAPSGAVGLKWPNDVFLNGGKACGILIESPGGAAPAKDRLVIGVGINVNNSWKTAPVDIGADGVALCDVTGRSHDLVRIMTCVLRALKERVEQLRSQDAELSRTWQRLNLMRGARVIIEADGRQIEGDCEEVAADGAIVIDTAFGLRRFYSGSLRPI